MVKIQKQTINLVADMLRAVEKNGIVNKFEVIEIIAQLRSLAERGDSLPVSLPKLVTQTEAAEMLGISLAHFKNLENAEAFPFKRKMIGTAVRYRNTDLERYILSEE